MQPKPIIDYTNKDFASLRQSMLDLARYRLPEWTDQSPSDLGVLLVDLFAYMGDIVLYYQDRIANESFLHTAIERRSVLDLLRLIGYELRPAIAASADLTLTFTAPGEGEPTTVTIAEGASFSAKGENGAKLGFQYLGQDLIIDLESEQVRPGDDGTYIYTGLPVRHSRSVPTEILGSSTGEPNQMFKLESRPLILESLDVEVNAGSDWHTWQRRDSLLYHRDVDGRVLLSGPEDHAYQVQFDESGDAWVVFGDGLYGQRPPIGKNNLRATYRVGGGTVGNVLAGAINKAESSITYLDKVQNKLPAAGGSDMESTEHAVRFGPLAFRSGQRAVTLSDYVALAHQAGGVAKVRARSIGLNRIELFVAPQGDTCRPVPDDLKKRLIAYFEDKRMAGTIVYIRDSICVTVDVSIDVVVAHHHDPEVVRQAVVAAIRGLLVFARVDFGQTLYLSKVYETAEALDGVHAATVTRFRRQDQPVQDIQEVLDQFGVTSVSELPQVLQRALQMEVASDGRIELGPFEIPALGELVINLEEATS